jgi:hypothetical protein
MQIQLRNVSEEYARSVGLPPGTTTITASACLQITAFLSTGVKSEHLPGEPFS